MRTLEKVEVNGTEVTLVKDWDGYYIYWGEELISLKGRTKIVTAKGRTPSQARATKKFLEAVEAARYITFSKL